MFFKLSFSLTANKTFHVSASQLACNQNLYMIITNKEMATIASHLYYSYIWCHLALPLFIYTYKNIIYRVYINTQKFIYQQEFKAYFSVWEKFPNRIIQLSVFCVEAHYEYQAHDWVSSLFASLVETIFFK